MLQGIVHFDFARPSSQCPRITVFGNARVVQFKRVAGKQTMSREAKAEVSNGVTFRSGKEAA
jgi:hypothetical protein